MINFSSEDNGTWFYFDESNLNAGVCLRELTSEQIRSIEKITVTTKKKVKRGVAYDDIQINEKLSAKLRWRYCIVDWKGIQIDGVDVECNNDNKEKLMKITDFVKFMADSIEKLTETNKSLEEARVKNSENSSIGDVVNEE